MKISTLLALAILALPLQATQASTPAENPAISPASTTATRLPDGGVYTDADVAIRGPQRHASPVRQLVDEGWLAATQHRPDAVRLNFARAMRIAPNDRFMLWSYGWAQLNLGQPEQALAAFRRNLALRPDLRPQWLPMAMALTFTATGDHAAAQAWYRAAAASDPVRWGSDGAALRHSQHFTSRERILLRALIADTAKQASNAAP